LHFFYRPVEGGDSALSKAQPEVVFKYPSAIVGMGKGVHHVVPTRRLPRSPHEEVTFTNHPCILLPTERHLINNFYFV
jgi:hypothetical protein